MTFFPRFKTGGLIAAAALLFAFPPARAQQQLVRQDAKLNLPRSLPSMAGYTTEDAFGRDIRFREPVGLASPPGDTNRIFVVEKHGTIQVVTRHGSTWDKKLFLDINAILQAKHGGTLVTDSEMGLLSIAFHPDFARNGYFYIIYCPGIQENGQTVLFERLSRFSVSKTDPDTADPNSEVMMINQLHPANNHNGGDLHFGADGYLYLSTGDGGNEYDRFDLARFIDKGFFSAIYRLDVDGKPGNLAPNPDPQKSTTYPDGVTPGTYKVPADNPFLHATAHNGAPVNTATLRTETWTCGIRNPWRFCIDPATNLIYDGDVGQDKWESVEILRPGENHGWSYYEGTHEGPKLKDLPANGDKITPPIYQYSHDEGSVFNGVAVIGGVVYHGTRLPELNGSYIFGDFGTRRLWGLQQVGANWVPTLLTTFGGVSAFGTDPLNGDLLAVDLGGNIGRLVRATANTPPPPALLSQTGIFSNPATLSVSPGMAPYAPIEQGWNGPVATQRWFGIPNGQKMYFHSSGAWEFPAGMVWVQQFNAAPPGGTAATVKLETRLLVKTDDSIYGLTYKWRPDQTDADLVPEAGLTDPPPAFSQMPGHHYPGRAECAMCHSAVAGYALSFNTWQLDRPSQLDPRVNQIQALLNSGYLEDRHRDRDPAWHAYAAINDTTQPLENRVRSYLAVNCVSCHQPGGLGLGLWDARPTTPLADARIVGAQLVSNFGDPANRFVAPGDPGHSMLLRRLEGDGAPKMPLTGVPEIDAKAIAVITQWVRSLPANETAAH